MADALKNGDIKLFNKWANEFADQTGHTAPSNFEAVKDIVADEVTKGAIGGPGGVGDREAMARKISGAKSPAALSQTFDAWTELLAGQAKGLEQQYEGSTGRKDYRKRYLSQRAQEALDDVDKAQASASTKAPAAGGKKRSAADFFH
jgi:hypothetical protein